MIMSSTIAPSPGNQVKHILAGSMHENDTNSPEE